MVVPHAHGFKSVKWLQHITLTNDYRVSDTYAVIDKVHVDGSRYTFDFDYNTKRYYIYHIDTSPSNHTYSKKRNID